MLHKLLSTFEYEPENIKENDKGYFRFEARPVMIDDGLGLEIVLTVPLQNNLLTTADTAVANQASLKKVQFDKLISLLKSYQLDNARDFNANDTSVFANANENIHKIFLTPQGLIKLQALEGMPRGILSGTIQPYRELKICSSGDQQQMADELRAVINCDSVLFGFAPKNDEYTIFVNDNFCTHNQHDNENRSERSKRFRKTFIETTLRDALITLISRKLNVTHAQIAHKCQRSGNSFSISLKRLDYLKLMDITQQQLRGNPSLAGSAVPIPSSDAPQLVAIQANEFNLATAKQVLDDEIFLLINKPIYEDKASIHEIVRDTFSRLKDLDEVCDLYDYITQPEKKEFINIHKNPLYDSIFRKPNTSSWQELIHVIREHAFSLLIKKIRLENITVAEILKAKDHVLLLNLSSQEILELQNYKAKPVFSDPRANSFVLRWFNTDTVTAIDKLIESGTANLDQGVTETFEI